MASCVRSAAAAGPTIRWHTAKRRSWCAESNSFQAARSARPRWRIRATSAASRWGQSGALRAEAEGCCGRPWSNALEGTARVGGAPLRGMRGENYPATMLIILPGTTTTFFTLLPASAACTFSSAMAAASCAA